MVPPTKGGKENCHGSPLGKDEIALTRAQLQWPHEPFHIPEAYYAAWNASERGEKIETEWETLFHEYAQQFPELADTLTRRLAGELPDTFATLAQDYIVNVMNKGEKIASRKASQNAINALAPHLPELLGGSADLAGSNLTLWSGSKPLTHNDANGNYVYYGVREFGMAAIMNGIALHGGFIPYGGTFLVFSDYARNAIRMSALMHQRVIYVMTHDSIGLGEDGPTHQPVEHVSSLRLIPNLWVWRPADATETAIAWDLAISTDDQASVLCLSRQNLPALVNDAALLPNIRRGGYILRDCVGTPSIIFIATGSEVALAVAAAETLAQENIPARVVSMPCAEIFVCARCRLSRKGLASTSHSPHRH